MAIPESGPLAEYGTIGVELGVAQTNVSIRGMSQTAGFTEPDAFSEFYGYSGAGCEDIIDNYDPFGDSSGVALYQLNGNATDVSTNYNGNFINPNYVTGVFGQAGFFDGTTSNVSCVDLPDSLAEAIGVNDFTFSLWINPTAFTYNGTGGIPIRFSKPLDAYLQLNANGTITFARYDGTGYGLTSNISITTNSWYHIVAQQSSTDGGKLYINGSLVGQDSFNGNLIASGTYYSIIGGYVNFTYANFWFQGSIDQTRIFNRTLTPLEIEALYTEELCTCGGTVDTLDILEDNSCIALYPLDGNANDLSGNYSGTPTNVSYGVGEFDLAGVFNGSSSYVNLNSSVISANSSFSISHWVKFDTLASGAGHRSIHIGNSDAASGISIFGFNSVIYLRIVDNSGTPRDITYSFSINVWYNLVITYDNSTKQFKGYVDNVLINTLTITGFTPLGNYGSIGSRIGSAGANQFLDGSIDQVRIFNKALSAGEVTTLYNETACTKITREAGVTQILGDSSCIAYYKLDGNGIDSANNNNGSLSNLSYGNGEFDFAGVFNGSSSRIYLNNVRYSFPFTISLWFKTVAAKTQDIYTDLGGGRAIYLRMYSDGLIKQLAINSSDSAVVIGNSTPYNDNQWHNIVGVFNSNSLNLYIDGQNVANSATFTYGTRYYSSNPNIGVSYSGGFGGWVNGSIDQVRIFNKAVTQSEVTTLYNEGI